MISNRNNKQLAGDNSTLIQAKGEVNLIQGLSYSDAKQIAEDLFKQNLSEFEKKAAQIATIRQDEIIKTIFERLKKEADFDFSVFQQPFTQAAIHKLQIDYVKRDKSEIKDLLAELLVTMLKIPPRDYEQLVYEEALHTAPKLDFKMIKTLELLYVLGRFPIGSEVVGKKPYLSDLTLNKVAYYSQPDFYLANDEAYMYMRQLGVLEYRTKSENLMDCIKATHSDILPKGFSPKIFAKEKIEFFGVKFPLEPPFLLRCKHNNGLIHFNSHYTFKEIEAYIREELVYAAERDVSDIDIPTIREGKSFDKNLAKLKRLYDAQQTIKMVDSSQLENVDMKKLEDEWDSTLMSHMSITGIGAKLAETSIYLKTR